MITIIDNFILSIIKRNADQLKDVFAQPELVDAEPSEFSSSQMKDFQKDLLVSDFQECMGMLRHYDIINWSLTKFSFGQILVVIGACWTILNYERNAGESLWDVYNDGMSNYVVGVIMLLSACFVFLTLAALLKNRTYFVSMSRYLNEHRDNVIRDNPFGFMNECNMWHNPKFPVVMDWKSTQILCVYLFVICFIFLMFMSLYSLLLFCVHGLCLSMVGVIVLSWVGFGVLKRIVK